MLVTASIPTQNRFERPAKSASLSNRCYLYSKMGSPVLQGSCLAIEFNRYSRAVSPALIVDEYLLDRKPLSTSAVDSLDADTKMRSPLLNRHGFTIELNKQRWGFLASVICLLRTSRPSAVAWFIVSVVVDAVNRIIKAGAFAHVIAKCFERIKPSIAYCNSTFSVAFKAGCQRAKASIFHAMPRTISRRIGFPVRDAAFSRDVYGKAPTTSATLANRLITQVGTGPKTFVAARAQTVPDYEVLGVSARERNDGESAESLPSEVENSVIEFRTLKTFAMINLSHDQFLALKGWLWLEPKRRYSAARLASLYPSSGEVCNVAC